MGQIAISSLWKYISYIFIGSIVYFDWNQTTITIEYKDEVWRPILSGLFRFSISSYAIIKIYMALLKFNTEIKEREENIKKQRLENQLMELQIKQLKDNENI